MFSSSWKILQVKNMKKLIYISDTKKMFPIKVVDFIPFLIKKNKTIQYFCLVTSDI